MREATGPLFRMERWLLAAFFCVIAVFGGIVEMRSAFLQRRMSDLTVFIRAGWAVRAGENIYQVSDEQNGWYYVYPPLFAIFMSPLAEAPPGADQTGLIPYKISVAIWYLFSVAVLFWGVHRLASALEKNSSDPEVRNQPTGCRRWWGLRMLPMLACIISIGSTLSHGQTNLLMLAMFCGMLAAILEKKSFQAGLWMAGPICMKVFPAFLLLYPLWRRDVRCASGCALGLFLGGAAIPAAVFGPERTISYYQEFADLVLRPGVASGGNQARADTLTDITATDTQSFMGMMHNTMHPNVHQRPKTASAGVRATHWGLGAFLTIVVVVAAGWRCRENSAVDVLFVGLLIMLMMFISPVCHLPYFCWLAPLIMGMLLLHWEHRTNLSLGMGWYVFLGVNTLVHALAQMHNYPGLQIFRDMGIATYVTLVLGGVALLQMRKLSHREPAVATPSERVSRAAA